jgi:thymidylate synthase ThyX
MEVKVLLDSINPYTNVRLTTLHCVYPQSIHQQVLTHRMFSRNSSSLRAISFDRVSNEFDIVYPQWTEEKKGMQGELITQESKIDLANSYLDCMFNDVLHWSRKLQSLGIHHQDINDYLRPFQNIHTVITATDFDNFFNQRLHESAKPAIQMLAQQIKSALDSSEPISRLVHLPLMDSWFNPYEECYLSDKFNYRELQLISAARLARISYFKWSDDPNKDLDLAKKLIGKQHPSPFEHVAFAQDSNDYFANFKSWKQLRHVLKF